MKYYAFIDESGSFDEALTGERIMPVVGGVCGLSDEIAWGKKLGAFTDEYNRRHGTAFCFPKHFHCSELVSNRFIDELKEPEKVRRFGFIDECIVRINSESIVLFGSRSPPDAFHISPQTGYVINLLASLKALMSCLANLPVKPEGVEIIIAQRTTPETNVFGYNELLLVQVERTLMSGDGLAARFAKELKLAGNFALRIGVAAKMSGLMAADFICYRMRRGGTFAGTVAMTSPEVDLAGQHEISFKQQIQRYIAEGSYVAAIRTLRVFMPPLQDGAPDIAPLLQKLEAEPDVAILERELPSLLAEAEFLIGKRVFERGALQAAQGILKSVCALAEKQLKLCGDSKRQGIWAGFLLGGLADLASCYNHTGAVDKQEAIEVRFEVIKEDFGPILNMTHFERNDRVLELQIRNLNRLFNDFRFEEVPAVLEPKLIEREHAIPVGERDVLLGKMFGSMGQACAFLAHSDLEWSSMARDYLEKSLVHLAGVAPYDSMSINYLATLAWQENDNARALREMSRHEGNPKFSDSNDLTARAAELIAPGLAVSPFDMVNYLRLLALSADQGWRPPESVLIGFIDYLSKKKGDQHPYEQNAKWLAYLCYKAGWRSDAVTLCRSAMELCSKEEFTMQIIGLSIGYMLESMELTMPPQRDVLWKMLSEGARARFLFLAPDRGCNNIPAQAARVLPWVYS